MTIVASVNGITVWLVTKSLFAACEGFAFVVHMRGACMRSAERLRAVVVQVYFK